MWLREGVLNSQFVLCILVTLSLLSCSSKKNINREFQEKYGEEMEKIIMERTAPEIENDGARLNFAPPQATIWNDLKTKTSSNYEQYYANVDSDDFAKAKPKSFYPDSKVYQQGKNAPKSVPDNMFSIPYQTRLSPAFRKSGFEFDLIKIPPRDSYGVITAMSEKKYPLVGNASLQKNIDKIKAEKSAEDIANSEILIKEQKQLRRRNQMIKAFGRDYLRDDNEKREEGDVVKIEAEASDDNMTEENTDSVEKNLEVLDDVNTINGNE